MRYFSSAVFQIPLLKDYFSMPIPIYLLFIQIKKRVYLRHKAYLTIPQPLITDTVKTHQYRAIVRILL